MSRPITYIEPPSFRRVQPLAALQRLPTYFDLLITLSLHRVKVRYKQSRLGIAWALLQPLALMIAFSLIFSFAGGLPNQGVPYVVFAYSALLIWSAFAAGLSSAAGALTAHTALVTKVYFPREILPLTYVFAALTDFLIASTALAGLMWWYGIAVHPVAIWALLAIALMLLFLVGAGLLLSALQVRHRDVGLAMPVLLQLWMFVTPVVYPLSAVRSKLSDPLYSLYLANPMAGIVDTFRRSLIFQQSPDSLALSTAAVVVLVLLPIAYTYFKYVELTMADVI